MFGDAAVLPGFGQVTADTSQVEGVESSLLSGIRSPCLAAVQQCADGIGIFVFAASLGFIHG